MDRFFSLKTILSSGDEVSAKQEYARAQKYLVDLCLHVEDHWAQVDIRDSLLKHLKKCLEQGETNLFSKQFSPEKLIKSLNSTISLHEFLCLTVPLQRSFSYDIKEHEYLVSRQDAKMSQTAPIPVSIIADNIRSAFNVGSLFRTSECVGIEHLYLCGYTATPKQKKTQKTAMGTETHLSWSQHNYTEKVLEDLNKQNIPCIALETQTNSKSIYDFSFPSPCAIVLGNERYGIDSTILKKCDATVHIPVHGTKNSLNVSVAFALCAYEIRRQGLDSPLPML